MEYLDWKSIGSIVATFMFLRTALRDFLPPEALGHLHSILGRIVSFFNPRMTIVIDEYDSLHVNELYEFVQSYLSSKCLLSGADVLRLSKPRNSRSLTFSMADVAKQSLHDGSIPDLPVVWSFRSVAESRKFSSHRKRHYELSFHRRHWERVQGEYIPHVMAEAASVRFRTRERRLYTNRSGGGGFGRLWSYVPFHHPASFDTLALDPAVREDLKADLAKFVRRQEYYSRVGRSWKRGYLLYGPPGTGKTSLIAAIANFLEFDIYDLELTAVANNTELRRLLVSTTSKSVVVVEDVDCTLDLSNRNCATPTGLTTKDDDDDDEDVDVENNRTDDGEKKSEKTKRGTVTLSGMLNFVDGLWSSCVGERLMIFTTNRVDKLDPALLRAGRMDKHVHLSYCLMPAFRILARNYLYVEDGDEKHGEVMSEVEELLPGAKMTPADVTELFMSCNDDAAAGLRMVVEDLRKRVAKDVDDASCQTPKAKEVVDVHPTHNNSIDDRDADDYDDDTDVDHDKSSDDAHVAHHEGTELTASEEEIF